MVSFVKPEDVSTGILTINLKCLCFPTLGNEQSLVVAFNDHQVHESNAVNTKSIAESSPLQQKLIDFVLLRMLNAFKHSNWR